MAEITLHATSRRPRHPTVRASAARARSPASSTAWAATRSLTVDWRELRAALATEAGLNAVIHLDIDGYTAPSWSRTCSATRCAATSSTSTSCGSTWTTVDVEVAITLEGEAELVPVRTA